MMQSKNTESAVRFYEAFAKGDHETMNSTYAPGATFRDPIFDLSGDEVATMWTALCTSAKDFRLTYEVVGTTGDTVKVDWVADYTFSKTGRPVTNNVSSTLTFNDGSIVDHSDEFSFHTWARQALGLPGLLLGWAPPFQSRVRATAAQGIGIAK